MITYLNYSSSAVTSSSILTTYDDRAGSPSPLAVYASVLFAYVFIGENGTL